MSDDGACPEASVGLGVELDGLVHEPNQIGRVGDFGLVRYLGRFWPIHRRHWLGDASSSVITALAFVRGEGRVTLLRQNP